MISCNQTLAVMLTYQLNKAEIPDRERLAITLENTVIVAAPLIPWNIAAAMPLTIIEVPTACLLFAFYLYLIPLWNFTAELIRSKRAARAPSA
jgi:NhaC family Na+:H+ antiporter